MNKKKAYIAPTNHPCELHPEGMIANSVLITNEETGDDARMSRRRHSIWGEHPNQ